MLKHLGAAALIVLASLMPAAAQDRDPAIIDTIERQIEAFLDDDFAEAFSFASPMIQGIFGDAERFGMMVRQGYPMVWRPGSVEYLEQEPRNGAIHQKVLIFDREGVPHVLDYRMRPTANGWRIDGVQILRAPAIGA